MFAPSAGPVTLKLINRLKLMTKSIMMKEHHFCNYTHFLRNILVLASYILLCMVASTQMLQASEIVGVTTTESEKITINVSDKPLKDVLALIEKQSKYIF